MSYIESDQFWVNGALRFRTELMTIPASGVLVVDTSNGSAITLIAGGATELLGIEYIDGSNGGAAVEIDENQTDVKFIRAAAGFAVTVRNNATVDLNTDPIAPANRILTSSGKDFILDVINTQSFFAYVTSLTSFRWYLVDRMNYDAEPADWVAPPPDTISDALTRMAAAVAGLLGAPIP
jgi:hypothetical protein